MHLHFAARLLGLIALLLAGCNAQQPPTPSKPVAPVAKAAALTPVAPSAKAQTPPPPADAIKLLREKPTAELLMPDFKKTLTGKEGGSADWDATLYLQQISEQLTPGEPMLVPVGSATLVLAPAGKERVLARYLSTADGPRFNWLQRIPATPPVTAAELPRAFAANGFLAALTTDRYPLAIELLAPATRTRLAPPRDESEKTLGYAPAILKLRLNSFRARAKSFTLSGFSDPAQVTGTLTDPGPRPISIQLTPTGSEYQVESFETK